MKLTTDNRPTQIVEDYFDEIQALRARMRQLQSENVALRLENRTLRANRASVLETSYLVGDYWRRPEKEHAA